MVSAVATRPCEELISIWVAVAEIARDCDVAQERAYLVATARSVTYGRDRMIADERSVGTWKRDLQTAALIYGMSPEYFGWVEGELSGWSVPHMQVIFLLNEIAYLHTEQCGCDAEPRACRRTMKPARGRGRRH
jgi:hypothetical protein